MTARRRALSRPPEAIAVRAYTPPTGSHRDRTRRDRPNLILVLDTETTDDEAQHLTFGSYRVYRPDGRLAQEGLIAADDLATADRATLERYVEEYDSDTGGRLCLWTRSEFVRNVLWPIGYEARALIVGFNLPFDLSRLAVRWVPARNRRRKAADPTARGKRNPAAFSLRLFEAVDGEGRRGPHYYRPNIRIQALDSKRQFISFTGPGHVDPENWVGDHDYYRGRFLDLRTLTYVLTDRSHSLASAAEKFGIAERKGLATEYGLVTAEHIDYNRQDVRTTFDLYQALRTEWDRHPIDLEPDQAFSPAAIGKAYLEALGIRPPRERPNAVPDDVLGHSMVAYYGGRTECRIRKIELPVRYVDFSSMYPTVFVLLGLWRHLTCDHFVMADVTARARRFLATIDRERLHDPALWPRLANVICRIRPSADLLPVRARYGAGVGVDGDQPAWTIGLNRLTSEQEPWYTLADLVAAKILGGRLPDILEASQVRPVGRARGLRKVRLRGSVPIDPRRIDLFKAVIETPGRIKADADLAEHERTRLDSFLKVLANGASYGVNAEFRQLTGAATVDVHGLSHFQARVETPEEPGAFCFPPLAATITGAGRLLLALAQADLEAAGGTYVACDTDSLAIVSSRQGGLVACPNGPERAADGSPAIRALSWAAVEAIRAEINRLNPYDRAAVPHLLKLEKENAAGDGDGTGVSGDPDELLALATSSKRYVLYNRTATGIAIRRASHHGLGLYRSPIERPDDWHEGWPEWVDIVWRRITAAATGSDPGPEPTWFDRPAVSQVSITAPGIAGLFNRRNAGRAYRDQVKPFGFLLIGHVDPLAVLPAEFEGAHVTPIAPYTGNPAEYLDQPWVDRRTGQPLKMTTASLGRPGCVRLKTYRDVIAEYRMHPETKSGHPAGGPGHRGSVGVLPRLDVIANEIRHIGKESNRLDEAEEGFDILDDEAFTEYRDPRDEWATGVVPGLRDIGLARLMELTGAAERTVRSWLLEGRVPREPMRGELIALAAGRRNARPANGEPGLA